MLKGNLAFSKDGIINCAFANFQSSFVIYSSEDFFAEKDASWSADARARSSTVID